MGNKKVGDQRLKLGKNTTVSHKGLWELADSI